MQAPIRERERAPVCEAVPPPLPVPKRNGLDAAGVSPEDLHGPAVHAQPPAQRPHEKVVRRRLERRAAEPRFAQELEEMRTVHDLDEVEDEVEREATLYEWQAPEHTHRPKTPLWYVALAAGTTVLAGVQVLLFANLFGAVTIAFGGFLLYYFAQRPPGTARYRIMADGVAVNSILYHWRDLQTFNVIYEPGETMTVILLSKRTFAPYIHMEIGKADPVEIRRILLEFLRENQEMDEPLADVLARRLGF